MTEPKYYLVTEEELEKYEYWGNPAFNIQSLTLGSNIRSRPYNPQAEREKVLDKLCKICPFLDERPETCENCVVETVRKELRQGSE